MRGCGTRARGRITTRNLPPDHHLLKKFYGVGKEASELAGRGRADGGGRRGTHPHGRFCRTVCGVGKEAGVSSWDASARTDGGIRRGTNAPTCQILSIRPSPDHTTTC
jgi:hypothetical protein